MQSSAVQIIFPPASDGSGILPQSEIEGVGESEDHPPPSATYAQKKKYWEGFLWGEDFKGQKASYKGYWRWQELQRSQWGKECWEMRQESAGTCLDQLRWVREELQGSLAVSHPTKRCAGRKSPLLTWMVISWFPLSEVLSLDLVFSYSFLTLVKIILKNGGSEK